MTTMGSRTDHRETDGRGRDVVRWGPVVAGAVIGLAVFVLLDVLWLAIASGDSTWIAGNLNWFVGGSAAFALLLAGLIAGNYAGVHGPLAGLANGVTAWGFLFVLAVTAVVPAAANPASGLGTVLAGGNNAAGGAFGAISMGSALWTVFWSLVVGLVLAAVGGVLGGLLRRPAPRTTAAEPVGQDPPFHDGGGTGGRSATATEPGHQHDGAQASPARGR